MIFHIEDELISLKNNIGFLWNDAVKKKREIHVLRLILAHAAAEETQLLDLADEIVEIVCETRQAYELCTEIVACEPDAQYRNYNKIQKASPDIILAKQLEINWLYWHEYKTSFDMDKEARLVHDLLAGNISLSFLLERMAEIYFRVNSFEKETEDFLLLFPRMDCWPVELADSFKLASATHLAQYFQLAADHGITDRPDIVFREKYLTRELKKELLETNSDMHKCLINCAQIEFIRKLIIRPHMILPEIVLEKYFRKQRILHFDNFLVPTCAGDGYDSEEE